MTHALALAGVLAAASVAASLAYARSLRRHPWRPCRRWRCRGGRQGDRVWSYAFGSCPSCGGSGRKLRLGCRVLGIRPD